MLITTLGVMEHVVGLDAVIASDPDLSSCWQLPCESEDGHLFLQVGCTGLILGRAPISGWPLLRLEKVAGKEHVVWHVYDDSVLVSMQTEEPLAKSPSQILHQERQRETQAKHSRRILHQETDTHDLKSEAKVPETASFRASKKKNPQANIRRQLRFVASPQRGASYSKATDSPVLRGLLKKSHVPDLVATPPSPSMATISPCTPAGQNLLTSCLLAAGPPRRPVRKAGFCKEGSLISGAERSQMRKQSSTPYQVSCSPPPRPRPPDPSLLPEPSRLCGSAGQEDSMQVGVLGPPKPKLPETSTTSSKQLSRSQSEMIQLLPRSRSEMFPAPAPDAVRMARLAFAEAELALLLMDSTHRSRKPKMNT